MCNEAKAQYSPLYSQYMFNTLAINPGYAGSRETFCNNALYRTQWKNIEGNPVTQTLSAHTPLKNRNVAMGLLLFNDRLGVTEKTGISGIYAYRIFINKDVLSLGLSGGINALTADWSKVKTNDNDVVFNQGTQKFFRPSAGFGAYYYTSKWYAGLSIPELLSSQYAEEKMTVKIDPGNFNVFLNAGIVLNAGGNLKIKPSALLKYKNKNLQFDAGLNSIFNDLIGIGFSYRNSKDLVSLVELYINKQFRIGYSYDYNLSGLQQYSSGSHEFMLQYEFGHKVDVVSPRYF